MNKLDGLMLEPASVPFCHRVVFTFLFMSWKAKYCYQILSFRTLFNVCHQILGNISSF